MVAGLVNGQSIPVGWVVHLSIAAFIGALYGLGFGRPATVPSVAAVLSFLWAMLWWVLGGLMLMPLRLGGDLFVLGEAAWQSLTGRLGYGAVLGLVFALTTHLWVVTAVQDTQVAQRTPRHPGPPALIRAPPTPTARQTTLTPQACSLRQHQRRQ